MSTVRIKLHTGKRGYLPLGKCSHADCNREGEEFANGQLFCSRHLTLTLTVSPRPANLKPGQGFGR